MWARVSGGQITAATFDSSAAVGDGWVPVTVPPKPPDTIDGTWTESYSVVDGQPVLQWTARPWTDAERAAMSPTLAAQLRAAANEATLRERAASALSANQAFLALSAPTAAQVRDQVQLLTREVQALIRLGLGLLDATN